jgi:D-beta-D-heptose 7-phosphate kinase/D-beta-D-heptose 1-phosphate adenosyltransferase
MLDRFVEGAVERISPEAPIPVIRVKHQDAMLGGAGNVARNIAALGARAVLHSVIGDDEPGRELARLTEAAAEAHLIADVARPTTVKTRFMAGAQQLLRADHETTAPIAAATGAALLRGVDDATARCQAVVLSDYGKGVLTDDLCAAIIAGARARGVPVLVDPKHGPFERYRGATVLTPNRAELAAATGRTCVGDHDIAEAARALLGVCEAEALVVTRGGRGLSAVTRDGAVAHVPAAQRREVYDVSGAGDTVIAVLAAALAVGADLTAAAALANAAGGIVVGKARTAVVRLDELVVAAASAAVADRKLCTVEDLVERVAVWRRQGQRVGFTNGCFDLLHPGHVALFSKARAACDHLIVGLNSDQSVRRLKGEGRPVQPQSARAAVLASLADIDAVVVFAQDTPLALIETIRPDLLVKGADYKLAEVVGAEIVGAYGGEIMLAEIEPGHSATDIIRRVAG